MSKNIDKMSPDVSPSSLVNVRAVNNVPLYLLFAVVFCFLVVIGLVAMDRAEKQNQLLNATPEEKTSQKSTNEFARSVVGDRKDGIIQALNPPEPEQPNSEVIQIAKPSNLDMPPRPPASASAELKQPPQDDQKARIRQIKMQQLEEALKAKTSVQFEAPRSQDSNYTQAGSGSVRNEMSAKLAELNAARKELNNKIAAANGTAQTDPTTAYKERLSQIQGLQSAHESTPSNNYEQFAGEGQKDRWKLNSQSESPRSPYELRAGFVVPATLISGVNSDLPGQIMAQVSQDVFDTATGKWKLVPQGSRLVGSYSSQVAFGQSRILIAWQRIIFPDGKALDIGAMPGADSAGYAGFTDQVNKHLLQLYGSAVLMSAVTAGFSMSQPQTPATIGTAQSASSALSQALGQQLGQVTSQMISKNMSVSPTLEIRPGYRFNVVVIKDLTFSKPYQAFDY